MDRPSESPSYSKVEGILPKSLGKQHPGTITKTTEINLTVFLVFDLPLKPTLKFFGGLEDGQEKLVRCNQYSVVGILLPMSHKRCIYLLQHIMRSHRYYVFGPADEARFLLLVHALNHQLYYLALLPHHILNFAVQILRIRGVDDVVLVLYLGHFDSLLNPEVL